jgi:hypothetical protein
MLVSDICQRLDLICLFVHMFNSFNLISPSFDVLVSFMYKAFCIYKGCSVLCKLM